MIRFFCLGWFCLWLALPTVWGQQVTTLPARLSLFDAVEAGKVSDVQGWLAQGVSLQLRDTRGFSLVYIAAANGQAEVLKLLLEHGAQAKDTTLDGDTPLHAAVAAGCLPCIHLLVAHKADLYRPNSDGDLPLHVAALYGRTELIAYLLDKGMQVNARNGTGSTALHLAALASQTAAMQLLLTRGADPNARNDAEETPLHSAAYQPEPEVAQLLLKHGAQPQATNQLGETAGTIARLNPENAAVNPPPRKRRPQIAVKEYYVQAVFYLILGHYWLHPLHRYPAPCRTPLPLGFVVHVSGCFQAHLERCMPCFTLCYGRSWGENSI